jgi:[NiFe] hydrogenase assembly HybE family chaperone
MSTLLRARIRSLEALFQSIATTRMAGIPILHPGLRVEAIGFEPEADGRHAVGVLVTPWFMNLVRLPIETGDAAAPAPAIAPPGQTRTRVVGQERFDFIGALEPGFGAYEACSLFSPMFDFADHDAAAATARAVMDELRRPPAEPLPTMAPLATHGGAAAPSRRALLFGRGAASSGGAP